MTSAVAKQVRRWIRVQRDKAALRRSDPRSARALKLAERIEGFTAVAELSLLYHLALHGERSGDVVEIGSYLGRSTVVLARGVIDSGAGTVIAVDPHTSALGLGEPRATDAEFCANMRDAGVDSRVELVKTTSVEAAAGWHGGPVRMLFVDGWHSYEAVMDDVGAWAPFLTPSAAVVFDDYPHPGIRRAVAELRAAGVLRGTQLLVGKMTIFAPKAVASRLPSPPGAALIPRLGPIGYRLAYRGRIPSEDALAPAHPPDAFMPQARD